MLLSQSRRLRLSETNPNSFWNGNQRKIVSVASSTNNAFQFQTKRHNHPPRSTSKCRWTRETERRAIMKQTTAGSPKRTLRGKINNNPSPARTCLAASSSSLFYFILFYYSSARVQDLFVQWKLARIDLHSNMDECAQVHCPT